MPAYYFLDVKERVRCKCYQNLVRSLYAAPDNKRQYGNNSAKSEKLDYIRKSHSTNTS